MSKEEAEKYAKKEHMLFYEVSATKNTNISNLLYGSILILPNFEQFFSENKDANKNDILLELSNY